MARSHLVLIAIASFAGIVLSLGLMWWRASSDYYDYHTESWALIPALWLVPVLLALVTRRLRSTGPILVIASALVVSTYYMDVLGFVPGAVIAGCGIEGFLRHGFGNRALSQRM